MLRLRDALNYYVRCLASAPYRNIAHSGGTDPLIIGGAEVPGGHDAGAQHSAHFDGLYVHV